MQEEVEQRVVTFGHQLYEADRTGTEKGPCEAASALENASTERPSWEK